MGVAMPAASTVASYVRWFRDIGLDDLPRVGGKNASLGELHRELTAAGVRVPDGFAITVDAYDAILGAADLHARVAAWLRDVDGRDVAALATAGAAIRALLEGAPWPAALQHAVRDAYVELSGGDRAGVAVAVRSSATAEDLPEASFAGQQETFLGVRGADAVVQACRRCFASLFTDRAIAYRIDRGFDHLAVRLSIGIQRMVRSDLGAAGVMFTLDPESGFPDVVLIEAAYGLGEAVVAGRIDPDAFWVFKPTIGRGRGAILKRTVGRKDWKLGLGPDGRPQRTRARSPCGTPTSSSWRAPRSPSRRTTAGAAARPRRWTSSGRRTAPTVASTSCRRGPRRSIAARRPPGSTSSRSRRPPSHRSSPAARSVSGSAPDLRASCGHVSISARFKPVKCWWRP
jgi:hypothetical protein